MKHARAKKKPKPVAYRFIRPESDVGVPMYRLLAELVGAHHHHLLDARIALAWNLVWQPDVDGRVVLGKCKRVADLEREVADVAAYDFVIILRQVFWEDPCVTDMQRRALLDHELMHAAVKVDERGDPVVDELGRTVYRIRQHDLEEFAAIADRYGCWKRDLEVFAQALNRARQQTERWIGYRGLQDDLQRLGVAVNVAAIHEWTEHERREVATWAVLEHGQFLNVPMPACLVAATRPAPIT